MLVYFQGAEISVVTSRGLVCSEETLRLPATEAFKTVEMEVKLRSEIPLISIASNSKAIKEFPHISADVDHRVRKPLTQ